MRAHGQTHIDKFKADCTGHMSEETKRKEIARIFMDIDIDDSGEDESDLPFGNLDCRDLLRLYLLRKSH